MLFDAKGDAGARAAAPPPSAVARVEPTVVGATEPPPGQRARRPKACSSCTTAAAVFTPVKVGIAGEQYFEVLVGPEGRRPGDHRPVRLGARAGRRPGRATCRPDAEQTEPARRRTGPQRRSQRMNQILESVLHRAAGHLGEQAALVHDGARQHRRRHVDRDGGDADPGHERDGLDADRQRRRRRLVHHSAACRRSAARTTRSAPATTRCMTLDEADAIRGFSPRIVAVMAQAAAGRHGVVPDRRARERPDPGRHQRATAQFSNFNAERGRHDEPDRGRAQPAGGADRLGRGRRAVRRDRPARQDDPHRRRHFRVVGVSEKKGSFFGNSQDAFVVIPLGAYRSCSARASRCS